MGWLGDDRYYAALEAETAGFAEAVHDADPARPVPTCPAWTLAQLTEHVGQAQRWVTVVLERRAPVPNAQVRVRMPQDPDERSAWLVTGARRLGQAVREVGPQTEVWSWSQDHTAGFWLRRTTHDTLVHRVDAELAVGREVTVDPALAADGVADLLDMFAVLPRIDDFPELAELAGDGQTLHFCAVEGDLGGAGEWLVRRAPSGLAWERAHGPADVTVRGRAADLLLVLTRRAAPASRVEVAGDERLFAHWLDHSRF
jgi:uncharacterized protein (TIGR03083 family)